MIASPQPSSHNQLKSLNSFSVSLLGRLNSFVSELAKMVADETPQGVKEIDERKQCVARLRGLADRLAAGTMPATDVYLTTFLYQGRLEERIDRVKACVFWVYAV